MRLVENAKHRIVAVVSGAPDPSSGGGTLWRAAEKLGYQTWPAKLIKDAEFGDLVRSTEVDALLNVHSLVIINGAVLALPRIGSFNMHPGPLPRYAGLNAVSWAAYRRETTYGATIHRMVSEIDAGPIVYQSFLSDRETGHSVVAHLQMRQNRLTITGALARSSIDQSRRYSVHTSELFAMRALWQRDSQRRPALLVVERPHEVVNFVRACDYFPICSPWKHPRTRLGDQDISVLQAGMSGQACGILLPGMVRDSDGTGTRVAATNG